MNQQVEINDPHPGRPPHEPTPESRDRVLHLARLGMRYCDIAAAIGISQPTLRKWYRDELIVAMAETSQKVLTTLVQMATSGKCPAATIFYAKTRCGLGEIRELPFHVGDDDHPPSLLDDLPPRPLLEETK